jgi:hypothetical protein
VTGHCLDVEPPWHERQPGGLGATRLEIGRLRAPVGQLRHGGQMPLHNLLG